MARAIIGVRGGGQAKSRLAGVLSASERRDLAEVMLLDMLAAVARARGVSGICVVTPTPEIAAAARAAGAGVLRQAMPDGLNRAFEQALAEVGEAAPYESVVLLPGDLPLLESADLEAVLSLADAHAVVLAPALDGGTGAVALRAGTDFTPSFGVDSFERHRAQCFRRGLSTAVVTAGSLGRDLDRPEDIDVFARGSGRTAAFLSGLQRVG